VQSYCALISTKSWLGNRMESGSPDFLDLRKIRFPVGAVCSIGHRISGVTLAFGLPVVVYLLRQSLAGPTEYAALAVWLEALPGKAATVLFAWALGHHALAGVRHLLKDIDVGASLEAARRSAWLVLIGGGVIGLATAVLIA